MCLPPTTPPSQEVPNPLLARKFFRRTLPVSAPTLAGDPTIRCARTQSTNQKKLQHQPIDEAPPRAVFLSDTILHPPAWVAPFPATTHHLQDHWLLISIPNCLFYLLAPETDIYKAFSLLQPSISEISSCFPSNSHCYSHLPSPETLVISTGNVVLLNQLIFFYYG